MILLNNIDPTTYGECIVSTDATSFVGQLKQLSDY